MLRPPNQDSAQHTVLTKRRKDMDLSRAHRSRHIVPTYTAC